MKKSTTAETLNSPSILQVDISRIKPNPKNPRLIKDDKFKKLCKSLRDFPEMLLKRPLVCFTDTDGKLVVLGGNMRLKAALEIGLKTLPVMMADDWTEEQKEEFSIKDNVGFGEWNWEELQTDWDIPHLSDWGLDIPEQFLTKCEAVEDDYTIPDEIVTSIVLGDLFEINQHRLLCGDSTNADDVAKLMGGGIPKLMVTDPPYGVDYDADWRNRADRANGKPDGGRAIGLVTNDEIIDWNKAYKLFDGDIVYVWHAGRHAREVAANIESAGFIIVNQIIWAKNGLVISRGDYHWQHEPCWYAVRKGKKHNWVGDRSQTTLWNIDRPLKSETGHSTQKPIECMARPIRNNTREGESVYDAFIGSGTTMVAGHMLNRKVYAMEISPKYCEVTIQRLLKLDPTLIIKKNGEPLST